MKRYFVYMLRFFDGSYYVGITNNVERRMGEHRSRLHPHSFVSRKGNFTLVRVETFQDVRNAIRREKQIQAWSRKKKDALVMEDDDALHELSKKQF
jgi:putative endonuclease